MMFIELCVASHVDTEVHELEHKISSLSLYLGPFMCFRDR